VFLAQFFNTGILLLIVQSNLTEHEPEWFTEHFKGPLYDYYPMWFKNVGTIIIKTQSIEVVMPWITLFMAWLVPAIKRGLDRCLGK
jgi:hypothetical protein